MLERGPLTPVARANVAEPLMQARGLSYEVRGQTLLSGLDLDIARGRRTMIMGPNGAGKSLTLRLLHGLLSPKAGQVTWQGRPLDRAARRAQAMVFQRPVLLRRSVRANLRFALALRGLSKAERHAREEEALAAARLEHLAARPARLLSGGEQQRLAVARALALRPDMLLLDEPTASLDPASTAAVERLVMGAHARGVTVIMVTHDAGQARRLGDDVIFLQDGRVAETGPAAQVLTTPASGAARDWLHGRLHFPTYEEV